MLEAIVRPFVASGVTTGRRVIPSVEAGDGQVAHLQWGGVGNLPSAIQAPEQDPTSIGFQVNDCNDGFSEVGGSRITEDVRVQNPDDPDQYVIVQRIREIKFAKKNKGEDPNFSYVAYATEAAMKEFQANFDAALPQLDNCQHTYDLNQS